jgi:Rod binding domain-containing protein
MSVAAQPLVALANAAAAAAAKPENPAARKAARDFESFFFSQTLETMFAGVGTDPLFGGGPGETAFRSLMIQEYGKEAARSGRLGIADQVYREIIRMQEKA